MVHTDGHEQLDIIVRSALCEVYHPCILFNLEQFEVLHYVLQAAYLQLQCCVEDSEQLKQSSPHAPSRNKMNQSFERMDLISTSQQFEEQG